jgi:hypothetical protein
MARRPDDKNLSDALVDISKQRLAQRELLIESSQQERGRVAAPAQPPQTPPTNAALAAPK